MAFVLLKTGQAIRFCTNVAELDSFFIKVAMPAVFFQLKTPARQRAGDKLSSLPASGELSSHPARITLVPRKFGCYANNCYDILAFSTGMSCASPENKQFNAQIHPAAIAFLSSNPFVPLVNFCINKNEQSTLKCFTI